MSQNRSARSGPRRALALLAGAALGVPLALTLGAAPAAADDHVGDPNPSFYLNANDLDHILKQIQISEAHAYATVHGDTSYSLLCAQPTDRSGKCVPSPKLPFGLRTVDGSFNNLLEDREYWGAGGQAFPRWLEPYWRQADQAPPALPPGVPGPPPAGDTSMCEPGLTCYAQWQPGHFVYDASPRVISNLIVDQSVNNPAAVNAAEHLPGSEIRDDGSIYLPNMAPDEGLSAPTNAFFTFFGQFFDHGLDLVDKGGNGTLIVPLAEDDPLRQHPEFNPRFPYLTLTRATRMPGPDGIIGTADDEQHNETTPFVDQNQTYTSHPSHQFFLREYELVDGVPKATGRLLDAPTGGLASWNDVKHQARTVLGISLLDNRVTDVPQVVTDPYGNFVPGPNGFPLLVVDNDGTPGTVEGSLTTPPEAWNALTTGHAFLEDIAHGATPGSPTVDEDGNYLLDENGNPILTGYDEEKLGLHFVTGDGRGNENIGLSAVHAVFHAEHNRMIGSIEATLAQHPELEKAFRGQEHNWTGSMGKSRPHEILPGPEADDWSYEERLFQAARFATEMQYQHLVFEEFARTIQPSIDAVVFNENSYNADVNAAITAEFAHVVYRFGHSMLTEEIGRTGFGTADLTLLEGFLNPEAYFDDGSGNALTAEEAAGSIVQGTVRQASSQIDEFVIDTLRNNLLGVPLDLPTINILRGRDAGTAPLQEARRTFFDATGDPTLRPYANWVDFGNNLKNGNIFGRDETNASLVNFVAAYGTHPTIQAETTLDGKREAAALLVNGAPPGEEFLSRLAGATRHETAALISGTQFSAPVEVAYITTGYNFPDALAAGPLAAHDGGPILLTNHATLPGETIAELTRLQPQRIVVLGGTLAVAESVVQQLENLNIATVSRLAGETREETAVAMSQLLKPAANSGGTVYLATGYNFPDSLAASAVAARDGSPILLTQQNLLPFATRAELDRINPDRIVILGGPLAISAGVVSAVESGFPGATVETFAGDTRYDTAAQFSAASFTAGRGGTLYVTTGENYPDGLAVGPVAGLNGRPVLLIPPSGPIPDSVRAEIERLAPDSIVILGGLLALDENTEARLSEFAPTTVGAPEDRMDFMFSTEGWSNVDGKTTTGLDDVDFWTGGLAERVNPFGGMLGSSFNFVFEEQLEALQFGDRFYYLFRNPGQQLFAALEANSFSSLIERNTAAKNLPANIFLVQDPVIELEGIAQPYPGSLRQDPDGTWRWIGDEHIEIHGTAGNDRIRGDEGDDSISGKAGDDIIEGGSGNDTLVGGTGNDVLTDLFGDDVLKGGWGNDVLHSGPGFDILHGGPGHDFLINGGDTDNVFAGDGDDVVLGSTGRLIAVFAGEGDDWAEGSRHADLIQGDNGDQFQADVIGGNDVVIGRGGDDDIEGEGGDDIIVGEFFGTDRHLGNMGFDWITYYGETRGVDVDFLFSTLQRPDVTAVRDRFDQIEAMSGSYGDDKLRGIGRELDGPEGADPYLHKMTEATLDLVDGLRPLLQPAGHSMNYAARFMNDGPIVDTDGVNNMIVGGPGSDTIQGRGGDDFIDGDLMLRVQLALVDPDTGEIVERQDSAQAYLTRAMRGEIDPGNFRIVRELVDLSGEDDIDTSIYLGSRAEYTITDLGDGYYEVWHSDVITGGSEAEESEGADVIRNIEVLQFFDTSLCLSEVGDGMEWVACDQLVTVTLDSDSPVEDQPILATLNPVGDFDLADIDEWYVEWFTGEGATPEDVTEVETVVDENDSPIRDNPLHPGDQTIGQLLKAVATLRVDGVTYVVSSEWTANPVLNVNDVPVVPDLVLSGGPVVGQTVQAFPPRDGDGDEGASEAGWVYHFQTAADADFTDDVQTVQAVLHGSQYTFVEADIDRYLRVMFDYTDDLGTAEVVFTNVVGPVQAAP